MKKSLLTLGLMAVFASAPAKAQVLLSDTFAGENSGGTQLNYNAFANWTVSGAVDLIAPGNPYGLACSGSCVDLSGSPGPGRMNTAQSFAFNAGDVLRMSFNISGNQRNSLTDNISFGVVFGGNPLIGNVGFTDSYPPSSLYLGYQASEITVPSTLAGQMGFALWSFEFQALEAGSATFKIEAPTATNIGPILDDVLIERVVQQSVVPEPSTYAMLSLGLGALGIAARRRRTNV